MKKLIFIAILLASSLNSLADNWTTVRYFEQVSEFQMATERSHILFDWGELTETNNSPAWGQVMRVNSELPSLSLEKFKSLYSADMWPDLMISTQKDYENFQVSMKEKKRNLKELRHTLVYLSIGVKTAHEEFMFLLYTTGESAEEADRKVKEKLSGKTTSNTAFFIKKESGIWRNHSITYEMKEYPFLKRIPRSYDITTNIISSGKAYYDPLDDYSIKMKPFPLQD
ncbi:MAG: hypothetical protein V5783_08755 [Pontiella sp.]